MGIIGPTIYLELQKQNELQLHITKNLTTVMVTEVCKESIVNKVLFHMLDMLQQNWLIKMRVLSNN